MSIAKKTVAVLAFTAAGTVGALLGPVASAQAAPAVTAKPSDAFLDGAYGVPNYCTYNINISWGWAGSHSVTYKSSYWSYNSFMGRPMKLHTTYEQYVPYTNASHPGTGTFQHWCNS